MTPFVVMWRSQKALVVTFVFAGDRTMAVVIMDDRSLQEVELGELTLENTTLEMPNIFDWSIAKVTTAA